MKCTPNKFLCVTHALEKKWKSMSICFVLKWHIGCLASASCSWLSQNNIEIQGKEKKHNSVRTFFNHSTWVIVNANDLNLTSVKDLKNYSMLSKTPWN